MGNFVVEMSDSLTPITSGNFIDLVDTGYYDGVIFHRVIDNFMIQGGDPTGTGSGGPGYTIADEFDTTGTLSNVQKSISMANSGPNTGGSQFFINLVNNTYLDWDKPPYTSAHPVFGMVVDSFNIVQDIGNVAVNAQNRPIVPVVMDSLRILKNDPIDTTPPTAISKISQPMLNVRVFPNPVGLQSVIIIESPRAMLAQFSIHDNLGREVMSFDQPLSKGMNRVSDMGIDQRSLAVGTYTLSISGDGLSNHSRFMLTR